MAHPLIETKLYLPSPRAGLVARPRLRQRLGAGLTARLLLVSAPAGFGKTTLLVDWLASLETGDDASVRAAWLSLDPGDNDPARFWRYLVAALRTALPGVAEDALALLSDSQTPPVETLLTAVVNDVAASRAEVVLLLDDYHVIDSPAVHDGMAFLLAHLPQRLHLVLASRVDPPLPLARLRARGELVEIRAADLRFTAQEASAYLNDVMGIGLAPHDVQALEGRTEGWIAALQLAALSMTGRDDVHEFIAGFTGDDRYVVDYLVEEVLQRLPADLQQFLHHTSILDRMTAALCDAVTGRSGGRADLERLDRDNLFVVALDDRRHWYRYHHLFADVLRGRLLDEDPALVLELHRRAAAWHEAHGDIADAIGHSLAGADHDRAAVLIESVMPALRRDRREATLRGWMEALADPVLRTRPVLANALAGTRMSTGVFEGVEELLVATEQSLRGAAGPGGVPVFVDADEYRRLPADVAVHRSGLALERGDVEATVEHSRRALEQAQDSDHVVRGAALALGGLAAWTTGDVHGAHDAYTACLVEFEAIDYVPDVLGCSVALGDMEVALGRPRQAVRTYRAALDLADRHHRPILRGRPDMHVGIAARHLEAGDLAAARRELDHARDLPEHGGLPQFAYRSRVVAASLREADGDVSAAIDLLDEAERRYVADFLPNVTPVAAVRARTWARHGFIDHALEWVDHVEISLEDAPTYLREYEHLTLIKVLLSAHQQGRRGADLAAAAAALDWLLAAARSAGRAGSVIEIEVTRALVLHEAGDSEGAVDALIAALDLAEPEGYVRTFTIEGDPMARLLATTVQRRPSPYVTRLRAAFVPTAPPPVGSAPMRSAPVLVDALSGREHDVLRLLNTELNGPDIARELVVSLNTVRTHTKNLYMKLGVTSRRAAVARAKELDLI
ncbi:LuxR C-terminal-related transcriptional regulator [Nocardioides sp.]|uniref:LuxR C-terminal-related transcriptional regulator n=1 Tax=Nocardioides sp. TaxID=35761 RepID=UPI0035B0EE4B